MLLLRQRILRPRFSTQPYHRPCDRRVNSVASLRAVELRDVSKRFGNVVALDGASLQLTPHQVHVLAGENGSGKTTLMNILGGLYRADSGSVWIDGRPVVFSAPGDALRVGIGMVHQHFELVPPFTALENVLLGHEGGGWWLRRSRRRAQFTLLMQRFGLAIDLDARVHDLSVGVQQKIEILKSLYRGVQLLILDESTTQLTPQEVDALFATVRDLVQGGLTVVLITHKLREIRDIADRVSVMRRGHVVATLERAEASEERLLELLMGPPSVDRVVPDASPVLPDLASPGPIAPLPQASPVRRKPVETLIRLERVSAGPVVECSLEVRPSEILGVAGVAGNGQHELAEVIIGARAAQSGKLLLRDQDVTRMSIRDRLLLGLGHVPEDRIGEGILPRMTLFETFVLGLHHSVFHAGWLFDDRRAQNLARDAVAEYAVVAPSVSLATARLSGGNIQKILVARAMAIASQCEPSVLVAMNPARGLDLRTTALVHRRLAEVRERGGGVLLVSEDLDELMRLSDRIVVMYRGSVAAEFRREAFDPYRIGAVMAGATNGNLRKRAFH